MSLQWPANAKEDGSLSTTAAPVGIPVFQSPIPLSTAKYVFTQEWQGPTDLAAVALNTLHPSSGKTPDYSTSPAYILVEEGPRRDIGGGQVRWTRTYAAVPAGYDLFETHPYSFIGTLTTISAVNIERVRQLWSVSSRVQHDYFLTDPGGSAISTSDPITGTTYNVTVAGDIARIQEQIYCFQNTIGGALYGGITLTTDIMNPTGSPDPTWPSSNQYNDQVADALHNGWSATKSNVVLYDSNTLAGGPPATSGHMAGAVNTGSSTLGGQLVAEPSRIDLWLGNIWCRRTRYVLAR